MGWDIQHQPGGTQAGIHCKEQPGSACSGAEDSQEMLPLGKSWRQLCQEAPLALRAPGFRHGGFVCAKRWVPWGLLPPLQ